MVIPKIAENQKNGGCAMDFFEIKDFLKNNPEN
jgi:hypothetical protein